MPGVWEGGCFYNFCYYLRLLPCLAVLLRMTYFIGNSTCTQTQTKDRGNLSQSSRKKHPKSKAKQLNAFQWGLEENGAGQHGRPWPRLRSPLPWKIKGKKTMCLHCFFNLQLFCTHYSDVLVSTGLALSKSQDAVLALKSKTRGEQNQIYKWETLIFFPSNQCFLVKWQMGKRNKCSLGVSLGTRQVGKSLLWILENG